MCYSGSSGIGAWIHCIIASSCFLFYFSKTNNQDTSNTARLQLYKLLQTSEHVRNKNFKEWNDNYSFKCNVWRGLWNSNICHRKFIADCAINNLEGTKIDCKCNNILRKYNDIFWGWKSGCDGEGGQTADFY